MKFDFTEGEWEFRDISYYEDGGKYEIYKEHVNFDKIICSIEGGQTKTLKYNARLIACAPEMLEALIEKTKQDVNAINQVLTIKESTKKELYEKLCINEHIDLIEKATGKSWEEINKE